MIIPASLSLPSAAEPSHKAIDRAANQNGATGFSGLLFFILATPPEASGPDGEPGQEPVVGSGNELRCQCALESFPSKVKPNGIMAVNLPVETSAAPDRSIEFALEDFQALLRAETGPKEARGATSQADGLTSLTLDVNARLTEKLASQSGVSHRESSPAFPSDLARAPESATREPQGAGFEFAQNSARQSDELEISMEDLSGPLAKEQAWIDASRSNAKLLDPTRMSETDLALRIAASAASGNRPQRSQPTARESMRIANGAGVSAPVTRRENTTLDSVVGLMASDGKNSVSPRQHSPIEVEAEFAPVAALYRMPTADNLTALKNTISPHTPGRNPAVAVATEPPVDDFAPLKFGAANDGNAGGADVGSAFDMQRADLNAALPMEEDNGPRNSLAKGGARAPLTGEVTIPTPGPALDRAEPTATESRWSAAWRPTIERIAGEIVAHIRVHKREAVIQLDPPELGKIHIALHVDGDKLHALILTEGQEARNLLEQHVQELRQSLQNQRLDLVEVRVENGSWMDGRGGHPQGGEQHAPSGDRKWQDAASAVTLPAGEPAQMHHVRAEPGRVSMWA